MKQRKQRGQTKNPARARALRVLRAVRAGKSLTAASRAEHTKPSTVRRYVGSALRQTKPGGRFRAVSKDRIRRELQLPSGRGRVPVVAKGIAKARQYSDYLNGIGHFNRTGDLSKLRPFVDRTFVDVTGERVPFVTDRETLVTLAQADELAVDSLYRALSDRR
jgi:hypothetical protein